MHSRCLECQCQAKTSYRTVSDRGGLLEVRSDHDVGRPETDHRGSIVAESRARLGGIEFAHGD